MIYVNEIDIQIFTYEIKVDNFYYKITQKNFPALNFYKIPLQQRIIHLSSQCQLRMFSQNICIHIKH